MTVTPKLQLSVRTILISLVLFLGLISLLGMILGQYLLSQGHEEARHHYKRHADIIETVYHLSDLPRQIQVLALSSAVERDVSLLLRSGQLPRGFFKYLNQLQQQVQQLEEGEEVHRRLEQLRDYFREYMHETFNATARLVAGTERSLKKLEHSRKLLQKFDDYLEQIELDIEAQVAQQAQFYDEKVEARERLLNLAALITTIGVLALVIWVLSARLLLPIQQLRKLSHQIGEGEYSVEMVWPYQDELGAIAASFNEMAVSIREAHSTIERERSRLDRVLQSAPEALIQLDLSGRIELLNREASQLLEYPAESLLGAPFGELIEPFEEGHPLVHYLQRSELLGRSGWKQIEAQLDLEGMGEGKIVQDLRLKYRKRGGGSVPVLVNISLLQSVAGEPESLIIAAKDISDLIEQQKRLLESQRAMTSILHDIQQEESYKITRAMELVTTVVAISEGELELQADKGEKNDLFRDLAEGVNRMSAQIREQIEELRESEFNLHLQAEFVRGVINSMPEAIATLRGDKVTTLNRTMQLLCQKGRPGGVESLLEQLKVPAAVRAKLKEPYQTVDEEYSLEYRSGEVKRFRLQRLNMLRKAFFSLDELKMERQGRELQAEVREYLRYPEYRLRQSYHELSLPLITIAGEQRQFSLSLLPFFDKQQLKHATLLLIEDLTEVVTVADWAHQNMDLSQLQQRVESVTMHQVALFDLQHRLLAANSNYLSNAGEVQHTEQGICDQAGDPLHCYQVAHGSEHPCWELDSASEDHPCPIHSMGYNTPASALHIHREGERQRHVTLNYYPVRNASGEVWAILQSIHDITFQKELEQEIQMGERFQPHQLEQKGVPAALLMDGRSNIQYMNQQAQQLLNLDQDLLLKHPLTLLFSEERDREHQQTQLLLVNDVTERYEQEQAERTAAYQGGLAEMGANVLHNIGNAVSGLMHRAQSLGQSVKRLEEMEHALQAGLQVDDPKRLQQGLKMAIQDLHEVRVEGVGKVRESILSTTDHMADIISLQQSLSAERAFYLTTFSLNRALRDGLRMQEDSNRKYQIQTQVRVSEALDQVELPYNPFMQMLGNFIKNSREAIQQWREAQREPADRYQGVLLIQAEPVEAGRFRLEITDNGCGIAPEKLKTVFQRGETTKERGTGFGLHSVATFIQSIDGIVWAESEGYGRGAHMVVELPISSRESTLNSYREHAAQDPAAHLSRPKELDDE